MKMMSGWMRAGVVAGMAAMMVAAASAGAQTTPDAAQAAQTQAQMAQMEAQTAAQASINAQARVAKIQAQMARQEAQMAPLRAQMAPMMAQMEVRMAPMQAQMQAQGAMMQAQGAMMQAQGAMMQAGMVSVGDPQVKDDLFDGTEKFAKGASDVTSVNLGPDMLGMVSGKHGGDVAHKMNFMVVRSYTYPHEGMYSMADVDAYRRKLRSGNWNCFVHTYESKTGESTDICNRALPNNDGNEMVILTVEPKELTFIHMSGKGSLADLGKLGAMGGFGGSIPTPPTPPTPPSPPNQ
jgi:hypothetical protein